VRTDAPGGRGCDSVARPAPGADRTVAVLELLADHPDERFTLSEVARRCGLNKATAHALLSALTDHGVLLRHPGEKRYSLGPRLIAIGDAARRGYTALDFVPPVLDDLVAATGLWARAWQLTEDHVMSVAWAGGRSGRDPSVTVRLPWAPPIGALFVAWGDEPTIEAWLARAATVDAVGPAHEALPAIRREGFAVTMASREWRALVDPAAEPERAGTDPAAVEEARRARLLAVARQPLIVPHLEDDATYGASDVGAPVFGPSGRVELVVSLSGLAGRTSTGAELRALGRRVAAAGDELTSAVGGQRPVAAR
jgi:DNA-binding IclR family transcriptional regulator